MGCLGLWELGKGKRWNAVFPATYLPVSVLCVQVCKKRRPTPKGRSWELRQKVGELLFELCNPDFRPEFLLQLYAGAQMFEGSG